MKRAIFAGCLAVVFLLTMSAILLHQTAQEPERNELMDEPETQSLSAIEVPARLLIEDAGQAFDAGHSVRLLLGGTVVELTLDEYLAGVVLAEMPASFASAALEAQAVAARTFFLKRTMAPKHSDADLCADGACCQQYTSVEAMREKLGENYEQYVNKVRDAVDATDGTVITYNGELIDAVYFSCSGGKTEDAVAVWGGDVPYLRTVESPNEMGGVRFSDSKTVLTEDFCSALLAKNPSVTLSGAPVSWFGDVCYTNGGGVASMEIGGVYFTGTELRQLFALRSACFEVSVSADGITFETLGYGHRVGMSQYGAQAMALNGSSFQEILSHYYSGVLVEKYIP